jgi:hypothetical protein
VNELLRSHNVSTVGPLSPWKVAKNVILHGCHTSHCEKLVSKCFLKLDGWPLLKYITLQTVALLVLSFTHFRYQKRWAEILKYLRQSQITINCHVQFFCGGILQVDGTRWTAATYKQWLTLMICNPLQPSCLQSVLQILWVLECKQHMQNFCLK